MSYAAQPLYTNNLRQPAIMGHFNSKFAYTLGVSAVAGVIAYILIGPNNTPKRKSLKEQQIKGLENRGNTCYISAVIQSLAACDHFKEFVRLYYRRYNPVDGNGRSILNSKSQLFPLVAALHRACLVVNGQDRTENPDLAPHLVILRILANLKYRLPRGSEQDSFELFEFVMSGVQEELIRMSKESKASDYACIIPNIDSEDSHMPLVEVVVEKMDDKAKSESESISTNYVMIDASGDKMELTSTNEADLPKIPNTAHKLGFYHSIAPKIRGNPFIGCMASRLQCLTCLSENPWNVERFHGITLPLPSIRSDRVLLRDLLNSYLRTVIVHEVECAQCTVKNGIPTKSSFSKSTVIVKMPKTLCLHVQRSAWSSFGSHKRTDYVVFSEILDLSKIQRLQDYIKISNQKKGLYKSKEVSPGDLPQISCYQRSRYRLCSVISHCGAPDSGHFVTFRRGSVDKDLWFLTSDEDVLEVPPMSVFNSKAYMLFYELVESPT